jgi:hypothetical protein
MGDARFFNEGQTPSLWLATRLGLQTGQARLGAVQGKARLGAVRGKPVREPDRWLATRLGLQTGQARLGAVQGKNVWEPFRAFLGARQTVQRRSSVTLSGNPTGVRRPPTGLPRPVPTVQS